MNDQGLEQAWEHTHAQAQHPIEQDAGYYADMDDLLRQAAGRPLDAEQETELIDLMARVEVSDEADIWNIGRSLDLETYAHIVWHNETVASWLYLFAPPRVLDVAAIGAGAVAEADRVFADDPLLQDPDIEPEAREAMLEFEALERRVYTKLLEFLNL